MEIGRCTDKEKHDGSAQSVCAFIDEGMKDEKMSKTHCLKRLMTVHSNMKVDEVHEDGDHEDMDAKLQEAWDDVSGAALDPKEVRRAGRSSTSKTRRFGGGSLYKTLPRRGTRS